MTNQELSIATVNLIQEYSGIVGYPTIPSVQEYIALRNQALLEVKSGINHFTCETDAKTQNRPKIPIEQPTYFTRPFLTEPRFEPRTPLKPETPVSTNKAQEQPMYPHLEIPNTEVDKQQKTTEIKLEKKETGEEPNRISPSIKEESTKEKVEKPKSDFEILRGLKDEWN